MYIYIFAHAVGKKTGKIVVFTDTSKIENFKN